MNDKFAIDTNTLVYAFDESEGEKRNKCFKLINSIFKGEKQAYITNQIIAETFITLLKKVDNPNPLENAENIINAVINSQNWIKINYTTQTTKKAITLVKNYNLKFWDALIAATMFENDVFSLYTEDEKDFKKVPGLKVINLMK